MAHLLIVESNRNLNDQEMLRLREALQSSLTLLDEGHNAFIILPAGISLKLLKPERSEIVYLEPQERGDLFSGPTINAFNIPGESA